MFYRVSSAVIAPDLIQTFRLNAESLGVLGGAFFYSFALMQIPMGVLLDRIGPRYVMTFFGLVGALGAFVFASSTTFSFAITGRILMGMGMASVLMGSFKVFVLRFPSNKFSTFSGALIAIGTLGSILATSPLAWLSMNIGWRFTFFIAGIITIIFALFIFWVLKDQTDQKEVSADITANGDHKTSIKTLVRIVLGSLSFWQIAMFAFFRYGTFVALQGLWLGTYLIDVKGFSPVRAGNILMMLSIVLYALCLLPLTGIVEIDNPVLLGALFSLIGFFNSPGTLAYTHVKELYPIHISGTVIAAANFFVMAGGAVLTPALGIIIETITPKGQLYTPAAYHSAFLVCFLGTAASLVFYGFSKSSTSQKDRIMD